VNRDRLSAIAHGNHPVAAPLSDTAVDDLLRRVAARDPRRVLDIGCGAAQWLVRLLELVPSASGVGVDLSSEATTAAIALAERRGVSDRVEIRCQDASRIGDARYDALLCVGSTHALGGLQATLQALHAHASDGATMLVGDGFWERTPQQAALDSLEATTDEFPSYAALAALVESSGWAPLHIHVSTQAEWDDYEWSWVSTLSGWARRHPDDPDAADARAFAQQHQQQWLAGYRGTLGFATVVAEKISQ
jgi:cyclopropane fatty-acyl-phospholipid synthase-like methyltransferase